MLIFIFNSMVNLKRFENKSDNILSNQVTQHFNRVKMAFILLTNFEVLLMQKTKSIYCARIKFLSGQFAQNKVLLIHALPGNPGNEEFDTKNHINFNNAHEVVYRIGSS